MCGRDQLWLNDIVSQYEVRYIKAADALMRELAKQKDYAGVMEYAVREMCIRDSLLTGFPSGNHAER